MNDKVPVKPTPYSRSLGRFAAAALAIITCATCEPAPAEAPHETTDETTDAATADQRHTIALIIDGEPEAVDVLEVRLLARLTDAGFETLEREQLRDVLAEQELAAAQAIENREARVRLGHVLGAEALAILTGVAAEERDLVHLRLVDARNGLVLDEELFAWDAAEPLPDEVTQLISGVHHRLTVPLDDRLYLSLPTVTWQGAPPGGHEGLAPLLELAMRGTLHADPRVHLLERAALLELVREQWLADVPVALRPTTVMMEMTLRPTSDASHLEVAMRLSRPGADEQVAGRRQVEATGARLRAAGRELLQELLEFDAASSLDRVAERERLAARAADLRSARKWDAAIEAAEAAVALALDDPERLLQLLPTTMRFPHLAWRQSATPEEVRQSVERVLWISRLSLQTMRMAIEADESWPLASRWPVNNLITQLGFWRLHEHPDHADAWRQVMSLYDRQLALRLAAAERFDASAASMLQEALETLPYRSSRPAEFSSRAIDLLVHLRNDAERFGPDWRPEGLEPGSRQLDRYITMRHIDMFDWSFSDIEGLLRWCASEGEYHLKLLGLAGLAEASADPDEVQQLAHRILTLTLTGELLVDPDTRQMRYLPVGHTTTGALRSATRSLARVDRVDAVVEDIVARFEQHGGFEVFALRSGSNFYYPNLAYGYFVNHIISEADGDDDRRVRRLLRALQQHEAAALDESDRAMTQLQRALNARLEELARHRGEPPTAGPLWSQVKLEPIQFTHTHERLRHAIIIGHHLDERTAAEGSRPELYLVWLLNPHARGPRRDEMMFTRSSMEDGRLQIVGHARTPEQRIAGRRMDMAVHDGRMLVTGPWGIWIVEGEDSHIVAPPERGAEVQRIAIVNDVALVQTGAPHRTLHQLYRFDPEAETYSLIADHRSISPRTPIDGVHRFHVRGIVPDHAHGWVYLHIDGRDTDKHGVWRYHPARDEFEFIMQNERQNWEEVSLVTLRDGELVYYTRHPRYRIDRETGRILDENHFPDGWPESVEGVINWRWPRHHVRVGPLFLNHYDYSNTLRLVHAERGAEPHPDRLPGYEDARELDDGVWMVIRRRTKRHWPIELYRAEHVEP
ncbi:MAG: hypothetical protein WD009_05010 [Phycisphaeraceae bacterium]